MRSFLLAAIFFCASPLFAQAPTLNVSTSQAVNAGAAFQFSCVSGCGGGTGFAVSGTDGSSNPNSGLGSITVGGLYTAPSSVTPHHYLAGCQILPNNHILNTRIDSLSVNSNDTVWHTQANTNAIVLQTGIPYNIINSSTPTQTVSITNNPGGNGVFQILTPPNGFIQTGWYSTTGADEHYFTIRPDTCVLAELDFPSNTSFVGDFSTTNGGVAPYSAYSYTLPVTSGSGNSGADVAGTNMMGEEPSVDEVNYAINNGTDIQHALRVQMLNGEIHNCSVFTEGVSFLWPATNPSCAGFGAIPEGARIRLKAATSCTNWTVLCNTLKHYGAILQDGTITQWSIVINDNDYGALSYGTIPTLHPADFEFVDESGLKANGNQSGLTTANREKVCYNSSGGTTCIDIVLVGVTLGLSAHVTNFVAGAPCQQLIAYVNGTSNTSVTWSMSPTVGTLTGAGFYCPPASVASNTGEPTVTTVTATSAASAAATATMQINVVQPQSGTIYLFSANSTIAGNLGWPWPITSGGITWQDALAFWTLGSGLQVGGPITSPPLPINNYIYRNQVQPSGSDSRLDLFVPNGKYGVTLKFADTNFATCNNAKERPELQGISLNNSLDVCAAAGGQNKTYDINTTATVSNNKLSTVIRYITGFNQGISAMQITPLGSSLASGTKLASGTQIQ